MLQGKVMRQQLRLRELYTMDGVPMPTPPTSILRDKFSYADIAHREPIRLTLRRNAKPHYKKQFPTPPSLHPLILEQILQLRNRDLIEKAPPGPHSSALFPKEEEDKLRLLFDYSPLNDELENREGPLPYLPELLQRATKGRWFSTLDLSSGYHQFPLHPDSRHLTAFSYGGMRYQWRVLPFGIRQAPSEAHHRLQSCLQELVDEGVVIVYIDDIMVTTDTREEHAAVLERVYALLEKEGYYIKPSKLHLCQGSVLFLGHTIGHNTIGPKQQKVVEVKGMPPPTSVHKVRQWMASVNWLAKFMKNVHRTMAPIQRLTRKGAKFNWTDECQQAYQRINSQLQDLPNLTTPDITKPFRLYTDASLIGCGAILVQDHGVLGYYSKAWRREQSDKWSARERELRAILEALRHFKLMLYGRQVLVYSDHESLSQSKVANPKSQHRKMAAWIDELQHYGVKVVYTKGKNTPAADWFSREVVDYLSQPEQQQKVNQ
jgi:hypothetical protein